MLKIHLANSELGDFTWEPPVDMQQSLLSLPPKMMDAIIKDMEEHIAAHLHTIMAISYSGKLALRLGRTLKAMMTDFNLMALSLLEEAKAASQDQE